MVDKVRTYWSETVSELKKVTVPTKDEIIGSTMVVVIVSLLSGFFMFGVDMLLAQGLSTLLGIG